MRRADAEAATRAGVHVLCKKPMAMNESECEAMIGRVERSQVKLVIAYRLHFERRNLQAVEWVNSGKIGEPRIFHSIFSQQVMEGSSRLKTDIAGGPIYDVGVYCIKAARCLFRAGPVEVMARNTGHESKRFLEVPATATVGMRFPEERIAS
jgi:glucose-fructose oxidoreductase